MTSDPASPDRKTPRNPMGPGAPLAFLIIAGVIIGGLMNQPSIGLLVGTALGVLFSVIAWRRGR